MPASDTEVGSEVTIWLAKIWMVEEKQEMLEEQATNMVRQKSHLVTIKLGTLKFMRWNGYKLSENTCERIP